MDKLTAYDIHLEGEGLRDRVFLLGNKRAYSLCLPVVSGRTDVVLHPHKWFGAHLYGRKFLEGQVVRVRAEYEHQLSGLLQTGFTMSLTAARREYSVEGRPCTEEFFVPDGMQGFVCILSGEMDFEVDPEFDLRFYRHLPQIIEGYEVEAIDNGVVVSKQLPQGRYDDATETFHPGSEQEQAPRTWAAVQVIGDEVRAEVLPRRRRARRKIFPKDRRRARVIAAAAPEDARQDHAPLWKESASKVYAPVRLFLHGYGSVVYGFGSTREEALEQLSIIRDNLIGFQAQKAESARELIDRAHFETGDSRVDTAHAQVLARLMDAFVARNAEATDAVPDRHSTMILAGNQYFHDAWKRDENIALGSLLSLGLYDLAREIIRDTWELQDLETGRLPQRIRAGEEISYQSSDGTLWALLRLHQYWRSTGDDSLLWEKLPMVETFFRRSLEHTTGGLLPSGRMTSPDYLWETWMDTPHTPRDGFPVEIQMLWISCLRRFRPIFVPVDSELAASMDMAEQAAWETLQRFMVGGVPVDSMTSEGDVRDLITPNAYFCFGLGLDLGPKVERAMRTLGRRQLAGRQGIITLAPRDWSRVFPAEFLTDRRRVRGRRMQSVGKFNYHRGVEWNWLSHFFVRGELKYGDPDVGYRKYLREQVAAVLERGGIGGLSELHDLSGSRGPEFQSWSLAGFLEALHAFAGIDIDVPNRRITLDPQTPQDWPYLEVRQWYGSIPFDLRYEKGQIYSLSVDFPWEVPEDVELEIGLVMPARHSVARLAVQVDGVDHLVDCVRERIPGSGAGKLRVRVPASTRIEVDLALKRSVPKLASA